MWLYYEWNMSDNPLLTISFHIPFDQIRVEHVEPAIRALLGQSQERIDEVVEDETPRSFDNTMLALERATENLDYAIGVVPHGTP
jgi:oligopeptidase A